MKIKVEMIIARGWSIWVNGQKPSNAPDGWVVGENGEVGYRKSITEPELRPLEFENFKLSRVRLLREDDEEISWESDDFYNPNSEPTKLYINDGDEGFWIPIKFLVYGDALQKVTTGDGVTHDIDEITMYIMAEG